MAMSSAPGTTRLGASQAAGVQARRWWILGVMALSLVLIGMDNTILNVALPTLQREFEASNSLLQWMVDAYILVFAGLLLTMGGLGDRFGRALVLRTGLLLFAGAAIAASLAQSGPQVVAARGAMGIGGAMIMPSTLSIIVDVFRGPERARAISIWAASAGIAVGLGPLVGGLLIEYFSWRAVFLVNVPIVAVAFGLGWWLVPESRDPHPRPVDFLGAALSTGAVSALVYAIIEAPARGWTAPAVLGAAAVAAVLAGLFAWRELHTVHPLLDFTYFRRPRFSGGVGAVSVAFFALIGMVFGMTQYLQFVQGYTALEAGVRLLPIGFGLAIGARASERIARRAGAPRVIAAGLLMLAVALAIVTTFTPTTAYPAVAAGVMLIAIAMGAVMAPSTDAVMSAVPEEHAGVGSAMNDVARQVAGALGIALVGSLMNGLYTSRVADAIDVAARQSGGALPPQAVAAARDSVGAATRLAAGLPAPVGEALGTAAREAFTEAFGLAVLVGSVLAVLGALAVLRWMPAAAAAEAAPPPAGGRE